MFISIMFKKMYTFSNDNNNYDGYDDGIGDYDDDMTKMMIMVIDWSGKKYITDSYIYWIFQFWMSMV